MVRVCGLLRFGRDGIYGTRRRRPDTLLALMLHVINTHSGIVAGSWGSAIANFTYYFKSDTTSGASFLRAMKNPPQPPRNGASRPKPTGDWSLLWNTRWPKRVGPKHVNN